MTTVRSNAAELAREFARRREALKGAIRQGLTDAAKAVDRQQVANLTGAGAAGTYPVPVRTGNLRASHFFQVEGHHFAVVGNTARYAFAVHEGVPERNTRGRPFLREAAASVNVGEVMAIPIARALGLRGTA